MFRSVSFCLLLLAALAFPVRAAEPAGPPAQMIEALSAEAYPERVAAQRQLTEWAQGAGADGIRWLTAAADGSADPEVRERALAVLKDVVLEQLASKRPGFVGIQMERPERGGPASGVVVNKTTRGSPAEKAGLRVNDVILELNGKGWKTDQPDLEFAGRVGKMRPGTKVEMKVQRGEETLELELELAPRPWLAGDGYQPEGGILPLRSYRSEAEAREAAFRQWMEKRRAGQGEPR